MPTRAHITKVTVATKNLDYDANLVSEMILRNKKKEIEL